MSHATASSPKHRPDEVENSITLCLAVVPLQSGYTQFPLYWLKYERRLDENALLAAAREILTDPLQEELWHARVDGRQAWMERWAAQSFRLWAERQRLPGVTDNLAHTVQEALSLKGFPEVAVAAGMGFLFASSPDALQLTPELAEQQARYKHYHPLTDRFVVHNLQVIEKCVQELLNFPAVWLPEPEPTTAINLDLNDDELLTLSKERLLALTLPEMKAIRQHFKIKSVRKARAAKGLPEDPTDVELEIIAQTWSEHCKHKIFNANIMHCDSAQPVGQQRITIKSLYKTYIQKATYDLMKTRSDLLSVFHDNSGVVKWNDEWAVCFKVETHNSPSALEPYGGALTGILGVNRDVLGTGLGAQPLFNTDVFCFAFPNSQLPVRPKLLPPEVIMNGVRKGVEDGGNKSGIPTVNGAIYFNAGYRAKPLVFCGTGGILPLNVKKRCGYKKDTKCGDTIVMAGGRVGKDGIHGATFSSESLHEGSPVSAVQIGDPFTQKRLLDFVLEARDEGLITGITDNGAGGLSSSVGEMAQITGGAKLHLEAVPTKYPGLADWEIVVSESQERMTISTDSMDALAKLASKHAVEVSEIGTFNDSGYFEVTRSGKAVAYLDLTFLHSGVPILELDSEWRPSAITMNTGAVPADLNKILLRLLSHPNICSREQVIRQYDHEVQGLTVIKPLMGAEQSAPCDAAVLFPLYAQRSALVVSNGLNPRLSAHDCYLMAISAADEAVRNAVCVGADPDSLTLLDNFCWPDPVFGPQNPNGKVLLGQLVRACQGLYDIVVKYGAPLISGKDSMKNDFDDGVVRLSIPPTLLVSALGRVPDSNRCVSMEFKQAGDLIYVLSAGTLGLAASHYEELIGWQSPLVPQLQMEQAAKLYRHLHQAMRRGWVNSAHDLSEGGLSVAIAECSIGSGLGATLELESLQALSASRAQRYQASSTAHQVLSRDDTLLFGEGPAHLLVSIDRNRQNEWQSFWNGFDCTLIGEVTQKRHLEAKNGNKLLLSCSLPDMTRAWKTALPFN